MLPYVQQWIYVSVCVFSFVNCVYLYREKARGRVFSVCRYECVCVTILAACFRVVTIFFVRHFSNMLCSKTGGRLKRRYAGYIENRSLLDVVKEQ